GAEVFVGVALFTLVDPARRSAVRARIPLLAGLFARGRERTAAVVHLVGARLTLGARQQCAHAVAIFTLGAEQVVVAANFFEIASRAQRSLVGRCFFLFATRGQTTQSE